MKTYKHVVNEVNRTDLTRVEFRIKGVPLLTDCR